MSAGGWALLVVLVVLGSWQAATIAYSACQFLIGRLARPSSCPAGGSPAALPAPKPGEAVPTDHEGPVRMVLNKDLPPAEPPHLTSLPAAVKADHASAFSGLAILPVIADISSSPDLQAFGSGVEAGVYVVALALGAVGLFGLFRSALSKVSSGD